MKAREHSTWNKGRVLFIRQTKEKEDERRRGQARDEREGLSNELGEEVNLGPLELMSTPRASTI